MPRQHLATAQQLTLLGEEKGFDWPQFALAAAKVWPELEWSPGQTAIFGRRGHWVVVTFWMTADKNRLFISVDLPTPKSVNPGWCNSATIAIPIDGEAAAKALREARTIYNKRA